MTSKELVNAAIAHQQTPRAPYSIHMTRAAWENFSPRAGGKTQEEFFDNDVAGVRPAWWAWKLQPDWQNPDRPTTPARVFGEGNFGEFYDSVKRLADTTDKYLLATMYGSHFEKAHFARGIENFLADMAAEPDFARDLLTKIIDLNMACLECVISVPEIDGVLLGSDWGTQIDLLCSPAVWEDMIRPGEQREYDLIHSAGKHVWVHSCGKIDKVIPSLVEMGLDVLNPVQPECMDIATLKRDVGDKLTFWGGISTQTVLPFGTPDDVRTEARRVRDLMGAGGGYILSPSQGLQDDVPPENIEALLEVAREERS